MQNLYNFLAQPNVLEYLDLSSTDTFLENVNIFSYTFLNTKSYFNLRFFCVCVQLFGALLRGCSTHLIYLNVSHNFFSTKKGKEIPPSFKQFFTSSLSLKHLNIAGCKLPLEALKNLLLGLACNESTAGLHLDLSGNSLGAQGAHVLESCIHGVRVLQSLDIGDNSMWFKIGLPGIMIDAHLICFVYRFGLRISIGSHGHRKKSINQITKYDT